MIFHENLLLADDSHEILYLIFFQKLGKMSQNLSSAAVVIGSLRINDYCKSSKILTIFLSFRYQIKCRLKEMLSGLEFTKYSSE